MKLYSTKNHNLSIDFEDAVFTSLPADGGLYMPSDLPMLSDDTLAEWKNKSLSEIAFDISYTLLKDEISETDLRTIVNDAINFEAPLRSLYQNTFVLELFHGPSLAFKDFGARFMSRIMAHFLKQKKKKIHILVATSGDTGGAVALGFLNVPDIKVTILYPKGKISFIQELQLTTNGNNIEAIAIDGTFDDCQAIVKTAFRDDELNSKINLTSANSINICRLIPQMFYYAEAFTRLKTKFKKINFVTPSGNFGNLAAGMILWKMGLPINKFIAATNRNDIVPHYLETGIYQAKPSVQTLANAMDVGDPSNFVRILDLFENSLSSLKQMLISISYDDNDIRRVIKEVSEKYSYLICPHTATAYLAVKDQEMDPDTAYVILATAHPCKFPDVFEELNIPIDEPAQVQDLRNRSSIQLEMKNNYVDFKTHLLNNL